MRAVGTRAAILDAAVRLGSLRGLEELSIGGLASKVEMSKSGLFAHFGSKEGLQLATVTRAWQIFEAEVVPFPREGIDPSLGALLERWLSFFERKVLPGGCLFVIAAVESAGLDGPVRDALARALEDEIAALEAAVRVANESGELPADRDPSRTAFALHSILVNANSIFVARGDRGVFDDARVTIGELLDQQQRLRMAVAAPHA